MPKIPLVLGILAIIILIAGCTLSMPSNPTPAPTVPATTIQPVETTSVANPQVSVSPGSVPVPVVTPVAIPATGFYIYVDYLGSFSGSFGTATNMVNVRDSGEHLYLVDPVNGTVTAGFAKLDDSSYPITVKVYESGQVLTTRTSADPFGMVNVTANP